MQVSKLYVLVSLSTQAMLDRSTGASDERQTLNGPLSLWDPLDLRSFHPGL